jgi:hypothetical protein
MTMLLLILMLWCPPNHTPSHVRNSLPRSQPVCVQTHVPAHVRLSQPRNQPCNTTYVPAHVRYSQPKPLKKQ